MQTCQVRAVERHKRCANRGSLRPIFRYCLLTIAAPLILWSTSADAEIGVPPPPIYNLYGEIGLLDMPTARIARDGEMSATFSGDKTGEHYNLGMEFLPWLEMTFRYSRIDRYQLYYPISQQGDLYDRSLGIKVRLFKEGEYFPSVVVGARDILGTGAYAGEYIAASKQFGDVDATIGMGWRRLAGGPITFSNPFGLIASSFKSPGTVDATGVPHLTDLFHGPNVGLFGGVSWQTPVDGLALMLELSSDDYKIEQAVGSIKVNSHLNFGFSYAPFNGLEIGGSYLYGSEFALRATVYFNAFDPGPSPRIGAQPLAAVIRPAQSQTDAVLDLLQSKTHFYANWPSGMPSSKDASTNLADGVFDSAVAQKLAVKDVELFGDSLVISVAGNSRSLRCDDLEKAVPTANMSGIHQIAFSFSKSSQVEICEMKTPVSNRKPPANTYASIGAIRDVEGDPVGGTIETAPDSEQAAATPGDVKLRIVKSAKDQGLTVYALSVSDHRIDIAYTNTRYRSYDEALGRMLRVLMAEAPNKIEVFRIATVVENVPTQAITLSRSDIERTLTLYGSGSELLDLAKFAPVSEDDPLLTENNLSKFPNFDYSIAPGLNKSFFDPDNPIRFGIYVGLNGEVDFDRHFSLSGSFQVNVYNTFNITRPPDSLLPHVRTDFAQYFKKGVNGISYLQLSYITKFAPDVYAYARAGYLEDMFGGVGGEVLWEPEGQRWALGADVYGVQQRQFDRLFGFRDYRVVTGHASIYYQSPFYGLNFQLHVGRYLAGDYGATLEMTRRFDNGIEVGAYATLTNVPFSVFGEGSFDKGIIIHIPLDNLAPINTQSDFALDFSPLTRDGGQRLVGEQYLYRYLQNASEGDLRANWDEAVQP